MAKAGDCDFCGRYWSERAGGIDEYGRCPQCAERFVASGEEDRLRDLERELCDAGAHLGAC